jgi:hypothetical protein
MYNKLISDIQMTVLYNKRALEYLEQDNVGYVINIAKRIIILDLKEQKNLEKAQFPEDLIKLCMNIHNLASELLEIVSTGGQQIHTITLAKKFIKKINSLEKYVLLRVEAYKLAQNFLEDFWFDNLSKKPVYLGTSTTLLPSIKQNKGVEPRVIPFIKKDIDEFKKIYRKISNLKKAISTAKTLTSIHLTINRSQAVDSSKTGSINIQFMLRTLREIINQYKQNPYVFSKKYKFTEQDVNILFALEKKYKQQFRKHKPLLLSISTKAPVIVNHHIELYEITEYPYPNFEKRFIEIYGEIISLEQTKNNANDFLNKFNKRFGNINVNQKIPTKYILNYEKITY